MDITKGLSLRALEIFVTLVEKGNMSKASDQLGMTQSSISQHITNQEQLFATALFDRSVRPMMLTPAGQIYYDHAVRVLDEVTIMWGTLQNINIAPLKQIRVAVIDTLADTLIPELTRCIGELYPKGDIRITSGQTDDHREALLNRRTDIIITMDLMEDTDDMERHPLYGEPFVLALPKDTPPPTDAVQLFELQLPFIRYNSRLPISRLIEQHLRRLKIRPGNRYEMDTTRAIIPLVASCKGWTITTPTGLLESRHLLEGVTIHPLPFTQLKRKISLVSRERELGKLPGNLADIAKQHLKARSMPLLRDKMPWAIDKISFYS